MGEASCPTGPIRLAISASSIQYGYTKLGTHARVLNMTLTHWNSKHKIRYKTDAEDNLKRENMKRRKVGTK